MGKQLILIIFLIMVHSTVGIGQILRFEEVTKLPSAINSDSEESMPLVSGDKQTMYFIRSFFKSNRGGKFAGQDIWMSQKEDSIWSYATNQLGVLNNKKNNAVIGIGGDGITLYLLDSYGGTVHGIAFSRFFNNKWTKPEKIPIKGLSKDGYIGFYMNPSLDILLISMRKSDSFGQEDLYVSLKDSSSQWSVPRNLGATINSSGYEISPFISNNNKFLFYASNGHPGFGDADIFVSERLYNSWDIWSVPKNLGPVVNSVKFDAYFTLTEDSVIYFSSNRASDQADIYHTSILPNETNVSQAHIDSLIREAELILTDLKTINPRSKQELVLLFNYNSFDLSDTDQESIASLLDKIEEKKGITISLTAFSGEGYSPESERLISNKRLHTIKEYLKKKGIFPLQISIRNHSLVEEFKQYRDDKIGAVKIILKL